MTDKPPEPPALPLPGAADGGPKLPVRRIIKSSDLLGGTNELLIEHNGGIYSLRQTSNGKLILTK